MGFNLLNIIVLGLFLDEAQKLVHFNFLDFLDVPIKCPKTFCIVLSSYVEGHVKNKFKSKFHIFDWFLGLQSLDVLRQIYCGASFEIIFRQK